MLFSFIVTGVVCTTIGFLLCAILSANQYEKGRKDGIKQRQDEVSKIDYWR
jgi:hypothetical protein